MGKSKVYLQGPTGATGATGATGSPAPGQILQFSLRDGVGTLVYGNSFPLSFYGNKHSYSISSVADVTVPYRQLIWRVPADGTITGLDVLFSAIKGTPILAGTEVATVSMYKAVSSDASIFQPTALSCSLGPVPAALADVTIYLSGSSSEVIDVVEGDLISFNFVGPITSDIGWNQAFASFSLGAVAIYHTV